MTATAESVDTTVTKKLNGTEVSGNTITWTENTDTLEIIVSNVAGSKTYTVEVTHNV